MQDMPIEKKSQTRHKHFKNKSYNKTTDKYEQHNLTGAGRESYLVYLTRTGNNNGQNQELVGLVIYDSLVLAACIALCWRCIFISRLAYAFFNIINKH